MPEFSDVLGEKYRLVRKLGEGGMGVVYAAEHTERAEQVAIKVLNPRYAENEDSVKRFYREAKAASAANHPGIVEIFDFGETDEGSPFLVMELLEGYTLGKVLKGARGEFDIDAAVELAIEVLEVLSVVHQEKVVHRDLKPENIFINRLPGGKSQIKLLDFGASKFSDTEDVDTQLTMMGTVIGSVYYMAPEQALGREDVDHRADLWSVGVILYQLLTGSLPFYRKKPVQILEEIMIEEPRPLRFLRPAVPPKLEQVIRKAMAKDRAERYQEASEFIVDLVLSIDRSTPYIFPSAPSEAELDDFEYELSEVDIEPLSDKELQQLMSEAGAPMLPDKEILRTKPMQLPLELLGKPVEIPLSEAALQCSDSVDTAGNMKKSSSQVVRDSKPIETFVNIYPFSGEEDEDITAITPMYQFVLGDDTRKPSALESFISSIKNRVESASQRESEPGPTETSVENKRVLNEIDETHETHETLEKNKIRETIDESPSTRKLGPFMAIEPESIRGDKPSSRAKLGWQITIAESGLVIEPASSCIMRRKRDEPDPIQTSGWFVRVVKRVKKAMQKRETAKHATADEPSLQNTPDDTNET